MNSEEPGEPDDRVWMSISDLAREQMVDKAAISRRVKRLEAQGLVTTRRGRGGTKLVAAAEFYRASEQATDAVRALNGGSARDVAALDAIAPGDPSLARQQARRAGLDADLKELELQERLGQLLPIKDVEAAMVRCAEAMVRAVDQIGGRADDLAAAVARDGVGGARTILRELSRDLRVRLGQEMRLLEAEGKRDHVAEIGMEEA